MPVIYSDIGQIIFKIVLLSREMEIRCGDLELNLPFYIFDDEKFFTR